MILADKQIRELCEVPRHVCTHHETVFFSSMTEEAILKFNTHQGFTEESLRCNPELQKFLIQYRNPTEEDLAQFKPLITPFVGHQVRTRGGALCNPPADEEPQDPLDLEMRSHRTPIEKIVSYGLSSYGYDVRLSNKFKIFTNINNAIIDPLNMTDDYYVEHEGDFCIIPPNSYIMGHTIEYFDMPRDMSVICLGKSTYARCGAIVNVTPVEAGFKGHIVIEISNATNLPLKIYANMGIAQFMFFRGDVPCEVSYADRNGKYQNQTGVQTALV